MSRFGVVPTSFGPNGQPIYGKTPVKATQVKVTVYPGMPPAVHAQIKKTIAPVISAPIVKAAPVIVSVPPKIVGFTPAGQPITTGPTAAQIAENQARKKSIPKIVNTVEVPAAILAPVMAAPVVVAPAPVKKAIAITPSGIITGFEISGKPIVLPLQQAIKEGVIFTDAQKLQLNAENKAKKLAAKAQAEAQTQTPWASETANSWPAITQAATGQAPVPTATNAGKPTGDNAEYGRKIAVYYSGPVELPSLLDGLSGIDGWSALSLKKIKSALSLKKIVPAVAPIAKPKEALKQIEKITKQAITEVGKASRSRILNPVNLLPKKTALFKVANAIGTYVADAYTFGGYSATLAFDNLMRAKEQQKALLKDYQEALALQNEIDELNKQLPEQKKG